MENILTKTDKRNSQKNKRKYKWLHHWIWSHKNNFIHLSKNNHGTKWTR